MVRLTGWVRCIQKSICFLEAQFKKEDQAREASERELRAEMITVMYEDIYFDKVR